MSDGPDDEESPLDDAGAAADESDDPFDELDDIEVEDDPFDELGDAAVGDPFDEVDVETVDESSVWDALGAHEDAVTDSTVDGDTPDVETEADEQIVPKRSYCEKCEYFSTPPETACTHPGTEIRELVDMFHFRVASCPVVARRRGIDEYDLPSVDESSDD